MKRPLFRIFLSLMPALVFLLSCGLPKSEPKSDAPPPQPRPYQRLDPILRLDSGGHAGIIRDMVVTADRKYLISASEDKSIRVWDVETGQEARKIMGWLDKGHAGKIFAIALSPDDKLLAVGGFLAESHIQPIRVYDFSSGKLLRLFEAHDNVVTDLAFSPDGRYLVSGSADFSVKLWDAKNNFELVHVFGKHRNGVNAVAIFEHGEGYRIVSGGDDNQVFLYSLTGKRVLAFHSHKDRVRSLAVGPSYIAIAGKDRGINIFDQDLKLIKTLESDSSPAALAFSPDGKLLLAGTAYPPYDCNVYSAGKKFKKIQSFARHDNIVGAAAFLDNQTVATGGGNNNSIYFWNPADGETLTSQEGKGKSVWATGINGSNIVWGNTSSYHFPNYRGEWEKRFDLKSFKLDHPSKFSGFQRMPSKYKKYSLRHAKGGKHNYENAVLEIRAPGSKILTIIRGAADGVGHNAYGFTSKGVIISGGVHGVLTAYNLQGQKLADFIGHAGEIRSIGTQGDWLVSGGQDQVIKLWDLKVLKKGRIRIYPTLNIFAGDDDEWAAWTEEGFFATSLEGGKYVGYHINQGKDREAEYISIEQLYHAFHRPELVKAKLEGKDISGFARHVNIRKILDNGGLPPNIRIITSGGFSQERDIYLEVEICDRGGGIGDFQLLLNGRPRRLSRSEFKINRSKIRDQLCPNKYAVKKKLPLALIEERAVISLSAYNYANTIRGNTDEIRIHFPNPLRRRADLHILTAAIDQYQDESLKSKYAKADAKALLDTLERKAAPLFQHVRIYPVYDALATRKGIEQKFKEAAKHAKAEDLFVLFLSGRGRVYDKTSEYYFLPADFEYSHENALPEQGISSDDLIRWIGAIAAEKALIILDAWYGEKAMNAMGRKFPGSRALVKETIQKMARATGRNFMAAGDYRQKNRLALEGERYQEHGAFSWVILQGLLGKSIKTTHKGKPIIMRPDTNGNGYVTVEELAGFVREALPKVTLERSHYRQVPYVQSSEDGDYPISVPDASDFSTSEEN